MRRDRSREEVERGPMPITRKPAVSLYVDRERPASWIVRDREGRFWLVPPGQHAWERRQPYQPTGETQLEPVPGHYRYMLGLPT
jgi:hypothetical protein